MKFSLKLLSVIALFAVMTGSANASQYRANIANELISRGTTINVKTAAASGSETSKIGENFDVITTEDLISESGRMLLPQGTIIRGTITDIKNKKMLSKDASYTVAFDHLVSVTGSQIPVIMGIHSSDKLTYNGDFGYGGNYGTASKQNLINAKGIITTMTKWGWETGDKVLEGYPKYVLSPLSAIVSVPCSLLYLVGDEIVDVFKTGVDVNLNQNETMKLMFLKDINVPVVY